MIRWLAVYLGFCCLLFGAENERDITVGTTAEVFPHIAIGGVWSAEITLVDLGENGATFPLQFFHPDGTPWEVLPEGENTPSANWEITIVPGGMIVISLPSRGPDIETGWAQITQPEGSQIGGHAIFTDRTPERPVFEAVVPLTTFGEEDFFLPFDNTQGNNTCIAIANPSEFSSTQVTLSFRDENSVAIISPSPILDLEPLNQTSFCFRDEFEELQDRRGVLRVMGTNFQLSSLAFRFNQGGAFTTFFPMDPL